MRVERILAPNPGPYTGPGTNTYLLASGPDVAVIDPGPVDHSHRTAIEVAAGDRPVAFVLVTHTHPDHAPLANPLARAWNVPAIGYAAGPEFVPDRRLADGDVLPLGEGRLRVLYTPGHSDDHVCFLADGLLFTGDHIMGGSSVMISDLTRYLASLERLKEVEIERMLPGHGPEIDDPGRVIDEYIAHRLEREREVVAALRSGSGTVGEVVATVYADVDPALHPLAASSVAAHLRKLAEEGRVAFHEGDTEQLWNALVDLIDGS